MSRRNEDFDEYCDPDHPRLINYEDVVEAAKRIKPLLTKTPIVPSKHQKTFGSNILYKLETLHPSGSFKERGSLNVLQVLPLDRKKVGVVIASLGNEAAGFCFHATKLGVPTVVVMPVRVPLSKIQKCLNLGAKVVNQGVNLNDAQKYARALAKEKGLTYVNHRDNPAVLTGYGTIALEILEQAPSVDAVIVPVGSGGLAAAITRVIKHKKPNCLVYGVQPEIMPGFFKSLENEEPVVTPLFAANTSMADAIAVTTIGTNAFANVLPLLDKMLLVKEEWISRAIVHFMEKEKLVVEGAGACTLAAFMGSLLPELKTKNVVCILTGGNTDSTIMNRCLQRGLTADGCLMKFTVGVKDDTLAKGQLYSVLAAGGYGLVGHFHDRKCTSGDVFTIQVEMLVQAKGHEHALELKRVIEKLYPDAVKFETEPFNDKRTCPCYVKKNK